MKEQKLKNKKWKRILKLADFVGSLPRKRFNFGVYALDKNYGSGVNKLRLKECGTVGCALGWAASLPSFRRLGLTLTDGDPKFNGKYVFNDPDYNIASAAGQCLFGVSEATMRNLFLPSTLSTNRLPDDATAKQWAKHARKIVGQLQAGSIT